MSLPFFFFFFPEIIVYKCSLSYSGVEIRDFRMDWNAQCLFQIQAYGQIIFMNKKQNYCSWWFHLDLYNHIKLTIYYFLLLRSFGTILIPEAQEECLHFILDCLLWWGMSEKGFKAPRPQNCPVCSCSGCRPHTVNCMRWNTSGWLEAATECNASTLFSIYIFIGFSPFAKRSLHPGRLNLTKYQSLIGKEERTTHKHLSDLIWSCFTLSVQGLY